LRSFNEAGDVTVMDSGPTCNRQVQFTFDGGGKLVMAKGIVLGSKDPGDTAPKGPQALEQHPQNPALNFHAAAARRPVCGDVCMTLFLK
jgi:hypothetical protein